MFWGSTARLSTAGHRRGNSVKTALNMDGAPVFQASVSTRGRTAMAVISAVGRACGSRIAPSAGAVHKSTPVRRATSVFRRRAGMAASGNATTVGGDAVKTSLFRALWNCLIGAFFGTSVCAFFDAHAQSCSRFFVCQGPGPIRTALSCSCGSTCLQHCYAVPESGQLGAPLDAGDGDYRCCHTGSRCDTYGQGEIIGLDTPGCPGSAPGV